MAEWLARPSAKQEVVQIPPQLKHACGESDRLLCWLYTPAVKKKVMFLQLIEFIFDVLD